ENGSQYFWSTDLPATFADGTIDGSWWDYGDTFPTQSDGAQWYFVDLGYNTSFISAQVSPTNTANFSGGIWSGNIAALQCATNMIVQGGAGTDHNGFSIPFNVLGTPNLSIAAFSNYVVLSWPVAASGFNLQQTYTLPNWTNVPGTPPIVGDRYNVTNTLGP